MVSITNKPHSGPVLVIQLKSSPFAPLVTEHYYGNISDTADKINNNLTSGHYESVSNLISALNMLHSSI